MFIAIDCDYVRLRNNNEELNIHKQITGYTDIIGLCYITHSSTCPVGEHYS